ncbi:hypothetical protein AVEN_186229-1, partial [Araneus ventricosus]
MRSTKQTERQQLLMESSLAYPRGKEEKSNNSKRRQNSKGEQTLGFPNDERLREKWLHAIPRKDFNITKNSKVCEKHFKDGEVLRNSTFYNEKTGETTSAPMKRPKLKENVVPSIFPGCPSYMSSSSAIRESPSKKRQRLEQEQIDLAVKESLNSKHEYELKTMLTNFAEFRNCIKGHSFSSFWIVVEKNENMLFLNLSLKDDIPYIKYAVSDD